jgi:protein tyrosine/serine phosphatase
VVDRTVTFANLLNFRDLGGLTTGDGRTVARRRLYRSDDLAGLSGDDSQDRARFAALGIRTVIDLRRPTEVAQRGRVPDLAGLAYHNLYLVHPFWPAADYATVAERVVYLVERYLEMTADGGEAIGAALRLIAEAEAAPAVVHCVAGKDRTGVVSALVLSLLGVDDHTVAEDYALSESGERAYRARRGEPPSEYMISPPAAMLRVLADLRTEHGSVEAYVKSIGVTDDHIKAMRAHLLV